MAHWLGSCLDEAGRVEDSTFMKNTKLRTSSRFLHGLNIEIRVLKNSCLIFNDLATRDNF